MAKVKFELNREGVRALMLSEEMTKGLEAIGGNVVARLGTGYSMNTHRGKNRVNVQVQADTFEAKRDNMKNNTILKAVQG